ncbi:MAG: hypothetical protein ACUVXJ_11605 [Phycisphaerae bacterium]
MVQRALTATSLVLGFAALAAAQRSLDSLPVSASMPTQTTPVTTRPRAKVGLNEVCPVTWRGTPLRQAFAELAERLDIRYILDSSIPPAALDEPVRLSASHLSGQQAFRWLARIGGLSAVLVDGVFLVAAEDRLPVVWRLTGTGALPDRPSEEARWAKVNARKVDINWVDAPLTGVAEDVAALFGVDLLYHPALLADPKLLYMRETGVNLERVREVVSRQLKAHTSLYDGALWVHPEGENVHWLPAIPDHSKESAPQADSLYASPLDSWLIVDRSVTTWAAFGEAVSTSARVPCVVDDQAGTAYPVLETAGSVAEVLEGLRMLKLVVWNMAPEGPSGAPTINIKLRENR